MGYLSQEQINAMLGQKLAQTEKENDELREESEKQQQEIERYKEALKFYSDKRNFFKHLRMSKPIFADDDSKYIDPKVLHDGGKIAREALGNKR